MPNFRDIFRVDREGQSPETGSNRDEIKLSAESPVFSKLQLKMSWYKGRVDRLLANLEKPSQVSGDNTEQVEKALFEVYKYYIRLNLVGWGSVNKQSMADWLIKNHPTKFYGFQKNIFNKAFDVVRADIEVKK